VFIDLVEVLALGVHRLDRRHVADRDDDRAATVGALDACAGFAEGA
jgi:hypothetical protein